MATKKLKDYDASAIQHLDYVDSVRKKPQMYIGPTDGAGIFTILREVMDNARDESLAGFCSSVETYIDDDGSYWVLDDGRGMPVQPKKIKDPVSGSEHSMPAIQAITSLLHAGGKFSKEGSYNNTVGCFTGDTRIRLLDGRVLSMEELHAHWTKTGKNLPVLSYSTRKQRLEPSEISFSQLTKKTRDLVEVTLDNGNTLRCTPEHPFYVRRGGSIKRVQAQYLRFEDSLVTTYYYSDRHARANDTEHGPHDYYSVTDNGVGKPLHRLVGSFDTEKRVFDDLRGQSIDIHHKNKKVQDNRQDNLERLFMSDHHREHAEDRSALARDKILETQADLRAENSSRFTRQNTQEWHKIQSGQKKALKIAARAIETYGVFNAVTYSESRRGTDAKYSVAVSYFESEADFAKEANKFYKDLVQRVGRSYLAEDTLSGSNASQKTLQEVAKEKSDLARFDLWKKKLLSFKNPNTVTPQEWNARRSSDYKMGTSAYALLASVTTLAALKRHVLNGEALVCYEDMSEEAVTMRRAIAEYRVATEQKRYSFLNYSIRRLRSSLGERSYSTDLHRSLLRKSRNLPDEMMFKMFASKHLGLEFEDCTDDEIDTLIQSWNHTVLGVRKLKLQNAVPVYDITVDHTHTFFVEAGVGVHKPKNGKPDIDCFASGVLVSNSHGVGIKATNFLSEYFEVYTFNAGAWWFLDYEFGRLSTPLKKVKAPLKPGSNSTLKKGTLVHFKPDLSIFSEPVFPSILLTDWSRIASYFTPGFKITLSHHSGKVREFQADGPAQYVVDRLAKLQATPLIDVEPFNFESGLVSCVLQFTGHDGCDFAPFTNGLYNAEKGVHFNAFFQALIAALQPFVKRKQEFSATELREGIVGLLNVKLEAPKFSSQTKEKLVDDRAAEPVKELILEALTAFFKKNRALAEAVCERAAKLKELRNQFTASKAVLSTLRKIAKKGLPLKACTAYDCKPEDRELYLVEGDSAAGCFLGDTKVRLINGVSMSFEEMVRQSEAGKKLYGYAYNLKESCTEVIEFDTPRITKHVTSYVEVELSNGEILRCTENHPFLLRSGVYKAAEKLEPGDSLMTHAEEIHAKVSGFSSGIKRRVAIAPGKKNGVGTMVYKKAVLLNRKERRKLATGMHIHHKDNDSLNDDPSNLEVLTQEDHVREHSNSPGAVVARANFGKLHAERMKTDFSYKEKSIKNTTEVFQEYWSDASNRKLQSKAVTYYFKNLENRKKTAEATRIGMRKLWLSIASHAVAIKLDPFTDAGFDAAKQRLDCKTPMKAKSWQKFFDTKSAAVKSVKSWKEVK
jgi:DNA gyrase/topoisomerase IV subunit B